MGKRATTTNTISKAKDQPGKGVQKNVSSSIQRNEIPRKNVARRAPMRGSVSMPSTSDDLNSSNGQSLSDVSDDDRAECGKTKTVPRQVSAVFEFATKLSSTEYQCKLCSKVERSFNSFHFSKVVRCGMDTNSNIRRHLAVAHGKMQLRSKSHRLPRAAIPLDKKRMLDEAAINCIIADARPWGDFKRNGMARFLSVAVPGYKGPSTRSVQRALAKLFVNKQEEFKRELALVSNLSITMDLWKSGNRVHSLCMTVHWLTSDYGLQGKVLSFRKFRGRHTATRIRVHMERIIVQFNLQDKITASTTDNGSNVKAAAKQIHLFGARLHCLAHALNLTIQKGLNLWPKRKASGKTQNASEKESELNDDYSSDDDVEIDCGGRTTDADNSSDEDDEQFDKDDDSSSSDGDAPCSDNDDDHSTSIQLHEISALLTKCRSIVNTIRKSSVLHENILLLARASALNAGLILDMRVRWNSSFKMLERLILYQPLLEKLYEQLDSFSGVTQEQRKKLIAAKLSGNDWIVIQALRRVLERFDEATKVLCGQQYPTSSLGYAIIVSLSYYLNDKSGDSKENEVKAKLLDSFNQYMIRDEKEMLLMKVSALLDPLTHDLLLPRDKQAAKTHLVDEVKEEQRRKAATIRTTDACSSQATAVNSDEDLANARTSKGSIIVKNFLGKCGLASNTGMTSSIPTLTIEQELAKLASIPKDNYEFTSFWQAYGREMPRLLMLVKKYLSICATSVPSESAFSVSNYVLRKNRLALSSKNVRYTMFLKDKI